MARTDNLTNFLTDVADAIRTKKGTTDTIPANTFDTEIKNLPSGSGGFTGHVDVEGLTAIGWDSDDIQYLQDNVWWNEEEDDYYKLGEEEKTMDISNNYYIRYIPKNHGVTNFYQYYNLIATPIIEEPSTNFTQCYSLKIIPKYKNGITTLQNKFTACHNIINMYDFIMNTTVNQGVAISSFAQSCINIHKLPKINCDIVASCVNILSNVPLKEFGGFENLGKAYTRASEHYTSYNLKISGLKLLTHDSLMNIINNLYDLNITYASKGTVYRQYLVLGTENYNKLTEEEIAIATAKGWDVVEDV